jgi:hypothetical protein
MLSWRKSCVLRALRCDLGDVSRCALSCTSMLSTMLIGFCSVARRRCRMPADARFSQDGAAQGRRAERASLDEAARSRDAQGGGDTDVTWLTCI